MTSRLDELADRDLAMLESAKASKRATKGKAEPAPAAKPAPPERTLKVAGYITREGGENPGTFALESREGEDVERWLCDWIVVIAMTRDADGSGWGLLLEFRDGDGREKRWVMPLTMLADRGENLRASLFRQGLMITAVPNVRQKLGDYLTLASAAVDARMVCVHKTGWHGSGDARAFVTARDVFGQAAEPIIYQAHSGAPATLGTAGSLDGWRVEVAAKCAGNSRAVLAASMAFAAPCFSLVGLEGGGIHLRGTASGSGKTTVQKLAASIAGPPTYLRPWQATQSGIEGVALAHNDLLLILDELGQADARMAGTAAYQLANGMEKNRGAAAGGARELKTWRTPFLSTGEVRLADVMGEAGLKIRAGQEVRVADVPAEPAGGQGVFENTHGLPVAEFAEGLERAAAAHHGHALRAWLEYLAANLANLRPALIDAMHEGARDLAGDAGDGQMRRVALRFALIAAAGEVATSAGITGWPQGEAANAARVCFLDWLKARGGAGPAEPRMMLDQLRRLLTIRGDANFKRWREGSEDRAHEAVTIVHWGYRRDPESKTNPGAFYILPAAWQHDLCAGFDHEAVARVAIKAGFLRPSASGRSARRERMPDGTLQRVYVLDRSILEGFATAAEAKADQDEGEDP